MVYIYGRHKAIPQAIKCKDFVCSLMRITEVSFTTTLNYLKNYRKMAETKNAKFEWEAFFFQPRWLQKM